MDEDSRLIRAMHAGSDEAIESFVRKYYPQIYSYCLRRLPSPADAEDAAQETFERFFRGFESYRHLLHLLSRAVFEALPLRDAGRGAVPALDYALVQHSGARGAVQPPLPAGVGTAFAAVRGISWAVHLPVS